MNRLQNLRKALTEEKLDAVLISSLPNVTYLAGFSGFTTMDRDAYLLVTKTKQYIFTHGIYKEIVAKTVKDFELIEIKREKPISVALRVIVEQEKIKKLGFEAFDLKVNEYDKLIKQVSKKLLHPADPVNKLRIIKTPDEIQTIKKACALGDQAFTYILKQIKESVTETDLATELEFFIKRNGGDISFAPIVAFGPNASQPHHVPDGTKLKKNSFILFDFGVLLNNYCSDMSRTIFFGKANKDQKNAYEAVVTAQEESMKLITSRLSLKKQIKGSEVDKVAREYLTLQNFPSMPHSLGHGIGLEVHEPPRLTPISDEELKPGMVFSIEPGVYLPGEFGIRIEDLFAIEDKKLIPLTKAQSKFIEL